MKSNKTEIQKRVIEVYKLLIESHTYSDILQYCKDKGYCTSDRTVSHYIKTAQDRITKENQKEIEYLRMESNAKLDNLYKKAYEKDDLRLCKDIIQTKCKINGLEIKTLKIENESNKDLNILNKLLGNCENK